MDDRNDTIALRSSARITKANSQAAQHNRQTRRLDYYWEYTTLRGYGWNRSLRSPYVHRRNIEETCAKRRDATATTLIVASYIVCVVVVCTHTHTTTTTLYRLQDVRRKSLTLTYYHEQQHINQLSSTHNNMYIVSAHTRNM